MTGTSTGYSATGGHEVTKPFLRRLTQKQPWSILEVGEAQETGFKRSLGPVDLIMFGVGGIIGAGIFVITGTAAADYAGPGIVLSFIAAAICSAFAGLCYSEMASMISVAGSAYTYAYFTMGELCAWLIGWNLILEYLVSCSVVAVSWSKYLIAFIEHCAGLEEDALMKTPAGYFLSAPFVVNKATQGIELAERGFVNIPAMLVVFLVTFILYRGISESARVSFIMVLIKCGIVILVTIVLFTYVDMDNLTPWIPPAGPSWGQYGWSGILKGASVVFFSYIGFDGVSTCAQEAKNPARDIPIGILGSLVVVTILYCATSFAMTGAVHYSLLGTDHPMSTVVSILKLRWLTFVVDIGATTGLFSCLLTALMGQPRIFYAMARDGLLPPSMAKIHPKYGTPHVATAWTGLLCALCSGFLPLDILGELTSVGTLFAFAFVCLGVMILRFTHPDLPRKFRVPLGPVVVPMLGVLSCLLLTVSQGVECLIRFIVWITIGLVFYFVYGYRKSKLSKGEIQTLDSTYLEMLKV